MKQQTGQVIIILLLAMLVALTIGLSLVQSSISDLATSSSTEQSSRAFSAAEAGIEQILLDPNATTVSSTTTGNQSSASVDNSKSLLPIRNEAIEYPPLSKADFAHFWFIDPATANLSNPVAGYSKGNIDLYFGYAGSKYDSSNIPAVELNIISFDKSVSPNKYISTKTYYDPQGRNGFTTVSSLSSSSCNSTTGVSTTTTYSGNISSSNPDDRTFQCVVNIDIPYNGAPNTVIPILARARILFSSISQPIALGPGKGCNGLGAPAGCGFPPQSSLYTSTGISGNTQKVLTVFKEKYVVPAFFDFAIFSNSSITK